jgi:hypothetical protein
MLRGDLIAGIAATATMLALPALAAGSVDRDDRGGQSLQTHLSVHQSRKFLPT